MEELKVGELDNNSLVELLEILEGMDKVLEEKEGEDNHE